MSGKLKFSVRGTPLDLVAFLRLQPTRRAALRSLSPAPAGRDEMAELATALHPEIQELVVDSVKEETRSARTYRLAPARPGAKPAYFRAGQYLSIKEKVGSGWVSRPYSISSAPSDALSGYYELCLRRKEGGLLSEIAWAEWKPGRGILASGPMGAFYHDALRDSRSVVGVAGGSGVTPFRSMAREVVAGGLDIALTLIYGCSDDGDVIFGEELESLAKASGGKFKLAYAFSGACEDRPRGAPAEKGFVTAELLRKYGNPAEDSFFLCGPQAMYRFVLPAVESLGAPRRRIRREAFGEIREPSSIPGYPGSGGKATFRLVAIKDGKRHELLARAEEPILVALERAGMSPPSSCRSGECQVCRSRLLSGQAWTVPDGDGRRAADAIVGYIHPCAAFPLSDIEIEVPKGGAPA